MSLRKLPEATGFVRPQNYQWEARTDVLAKWSESPLAAASEDPSTIQIFDFIGADMWTGQGFTAKRMSAALRSIGNNSVSVQINSPGGDVFEGIAIYNMLREHKGKVTVEVLGWAASIASVIAMAGDEIKMGLGTFMMVHNAWGVVVGNRHDMREAAGLFDGFDSAIVDIYEARTGESRKTLEKLMDAETFMGPTDAVKHGFADSIDEGLAADPAAKNETNTQILARRQVEAALAKAGHSRSSRSGLLNEAFPSTAARDAGRESDAPRDAGINVADFSRLLETLKS